MIKIVDGRIFVEGKETVDPVLIGYALLDFAESGKTKIPENNEPIQQDGDHLKNTYRKYLKENKMTFTKERKTLIEMVSKTNNFEPIDLMNIARESNIKIIPATCYNFLNTCIDANVLEIQPKKYLWKRN